MGRGRGYINGAYVIVSYCIKALAGRMKKIVLRQVLRKERLQALLKEFTSALFVVRPVRYPASALTKMR